MSMHVLPCSRRPLAAAICVLLSASAVAQPDVSDRDEAGTLATVTVTAQKREQQVEDVPIAITALSGELLEDLGVTGFETLGGYVPGLEIQVQSPNNPGFVIRGITSDSGDSQIEPRVSVFQDGVSISKSRGSVVELFDLERVEVLRGPQGTLFGRGAQTGAVHLIQNKARNETGAQLRLGLGRFDETLLSGHLNAPLVDDQVYGRLALFHHKRDGFIENLSGGTLNGKDTQALRGSLGVDLNGGRVDVVLNYQRDTPSGTDFRSGSIPTRRGSLDVFAAADLNRGDELGLERKVYGATVLGEFGLSNAWSMSSITGWRRFDSVEEFDADGSQVYALEFAEEAEGRQFSQELRFNYDDGGAFTGFAGASYFHERGSQGVPFRTDERSLFALLSPLLAGFGVPTIPLLNPDLSPNLSVTTNPLTQTPLKPFHEEKYVNYGDVRSWELFADGTLRVGDDWEFTLGLRATREQVRNGYEALFLGAPSSLGLIPLAGQPAFPNIVFAPTDGRLRASDRYTSAVGRAVARYQFAEEASAYASVARGRRPDVLRVDGDGIESLPSEIVWSYELGLKGAVDQGRLLYDLAVFYYDYSDFQASIENPNPPPFFITTNAGNARAKGAEASLFYALGGGFSAFANYGYIDARFNAVDDAGNPQQLAGNRFRLTPEHSASAGVDWAFPVVGAVRGYLRPSWTWRSQVYFEDNNQEGIEQPGYALFNLRAGLRFDGGRWELAAYGSNLFDKRYLIDAGNTGAAFGIPTFIPGAPRQYGIQLLGRFD